MLLTIVKGLEDRMTQRGQEPQDLVTGAEIGRRLGISRERVRQLAQRPDFPAPIGRLGPANVWGWNVVDEWRRANERVPPVEIFSATDPPHARAAGAVLGQVRGRGVSEDDGLPGRAATGRGAVRSERHRDDRPKRQGQWGPASHSSPLGRTRSPRASDSSTSESHHL